MELPSELLRSVASFAAGQGFTTAVGGEAQRPLQLGRQHIHLDVRPRRGAWDVHLVVRTSFLLDPEHDEYACSFRTTAHRLDSRWPSHWRLKEGDWTVISEQIQQAYGETLSPFLNRTQTPAGMVQWLCAEYEPLRLLSPSFVEPLRRGLALVEVLPQETQEAARDRLRGKLALSRR